MKENNSDTNPEITRAEAYKQKLIAEADGKNLNGHNWSLKKSQVGGSGEIVVQKEKASGEIVLYPIPEDFNP